MIISPDMYKSQNLDKNLKELVAERNKLLVLIEEYENRLVLSNKDELTEDDLIKPSPQTMYYYNNCYLKEITDLIIEKAKNV